MDKTIEKLNAAMKSAYEAFTEIYGEKTCYNGNVAKIECLSLDVPNKLFPEITIIDPVSCFALFIQYDPDTGKNSYSMSVTYENDFEHYGGLVDVSENMASEFLSSLTRNTNFYSKFYKKVEDLRKEE